MSPMNVTAATVSGELNTTFVPVLSAIAPP
jgi:hypothetical protein